jgi:hypothetical protein
MLVRRGIESRDDVAVAGAELLLLGLCAVVVEEEFWEVAADDDEVLPLHAARSRAITQKMGSLLAVFMEM